MIYTTHTACRLCKGETLIPVLDLGTQALSGQFPLPDEPDPPKTPLEVVRCANVECGLVQLRHTADPQLMFASYFYRSGISQTMRTHLTEAAHEASEMLMQRKGPPCIAPRFLDIGGNDGFTLNAIPVYTGVRVMIDPSDILVAHPGIVKVQGYFPDELILNRQFDMALSLACFYDTDDPLRWAQSVQKILAPDGLWVLEVADLFAMLQNVDYPAICQEHLLYLSPYTVTRIAERSGLKVVRMQPNDCNGGSVRFYLTHEQSRAYDGDPEWNARIAALTSHGRGLIENPEAFDRFRTAVGQASDGIRQLVADEIAKGGKVHLLAASTKSNTVLSNAGLDNRSILMASDRDPRKLGRRTPGTNIPIVSEETSRADRPTLYLSLARHFKDEMVGREAAHLDRGGTIAFPLPSLDTIHGPMSAALG